MFVLSVFFFLLSLYFQKKLLRSTVQKSNVKKKIRGRNETETKQKAQKATTNRTQPNNRKTTQTCNSHWLTQSYIGMQKQHCPEHTHTLTRAHTHEHTHTQSLGFSSTRHFNSWTKSFSSPQCYKIHPQRPPAGGSAEPLCTGGFWVEANTDRDRSLVCVCGTGRGQSLSDI